MNHIHSQVGGFEAIFGTLSVNKRVCCLVLVIIPTHF